MSFKNFLKWRLTPNPQKREKKRESYTLPVIKDNYLLESNEDVLVWLGHSSFFTRLGGFTFLTDPVFYDLPFIKRLSALPCKVSDLKGIDSLLLSHGHRDHLDERSLKDLI